MTTITYFTPIHPDTVAYIKPLIIEKAKELGLDDYFSRCGAFGGLEATLPNKTESKELKEWASKFCVVDTEQRYTELI